MELEEALKHLVTNLDIYRFVGVDEERTPDEIKDYMMNDLERPESTARSNMNALMSDNRGVLIKSSEGFYISNSRAQELEDLLDEIFKWSENDRRAEERNEILEQRDDYYKWWQEEEEANLQLKNQWHKDREKYEKRIRKIESEKQELQGLILNQRFHQNTLMLSSVEIGPEEVGFYKDSQFPFKERHPTIDERTMEMESYLKEIPTDVPITSDPHMVDLVGSSLAAVNMRMHQIGHVFSENLMERLMEHIGPFKERYLHRYPQRNVLSIEKLLNMTDLTSAEKLALYTVYCDDMSLEKKELLKLAGEEGISADYVIRLLEDKKVSVDTKDRFMAALEIVTDDSEYSMRHKFAMELLEKKWYIKANYCGKEEKFQLVPMVEIDLMKNQLHKLEMEHNKTTDSDLEDEIEGE